MIGFFFFFVSADQYLEMQEFGRGFHDKSLNQRANIP